MLLLCKLKLRTLLLNALLLPALLLCTPLLHTLSLHTLTLYAFTSYAITLRYYSVRYYFIYYYFLWFLVIMLFSYIHWPLFMIHNSLKIWNLPFGQQNTCLLKGWFCYNFNNVSFGMVFWKVFSMVSWMHIEVHNTVQARYLLIVRSCSGFAYLSGVSVDRMCDCLTPLLLHHLISALFFFLF